MGPEDYFDFYHAQPDYMNVGDRGEFGDEEELFPSKNFRGGSENENKTGDDFRETADGFYNEVYQYGVPLHGEDDEELYN